MLIAEELTLLLYDDERGSPTVDATRLEHALAGAILIELAVRERVRITETNEPGVRKGRLLVNPDPNQGSAPDTAPDSAPDDPLLVEAIELLRTQEGRKPKDVLGKLRKLSGGLRKRVLRQLTDRGSLRSENRKLWGIFRLERWPTNDPADERAVRTKLHQVLVVGQEPDPRTGALISILVAIDQAHRVLELRDRAERKAARERAKQISRGDWAGQAVKKAVEELQAAVVAGATAGANGSS